MSWTTKIAEMKKTIDMDGPESAQRSEKLYSS